MDESGGLSSVFAPVCRVDLSDVSWKSGSQPRGVLSTRHWRLDSSLPHFHIDDHSSAKAPECARTYSLPPHARLVRVLLRLPALSYVHRPGSIVQSERHVARRREAALH